MDYIPSRHSSLHQIIPAYIKIKSYAIDCLYFTMIDSSVANGF